MMEGKTRKLTVEHAVPAEEKRRHRRQETALRHLSVDDLDALDDLDFEVFQHRTKRKQEIQ